MGMLKLMYDCKVQMIQCEWYASNCTLVLLAYSNTNPDVKRVTFSSYDSYPQLRRACLHLKISHLLHSAAQAHCLPLAHT